MATQDAPLSRDMVDVARPWLRGLLGLFFVAYSANSTIFFGAGDIMWLFPGAKGITIGAFADAYWYASALAALLFAGEVATGEKYPKTYRMFLFPDAVYTARGIWSGLSVALAVLLSDYIPKEAAAIIGTIVAAPLSFYVGYLVAKWGEVLLFGKRRTRGVKKED